MTESALTPLLRDDSALDDRQKEVVTRVAEAEYAKILSLPTDDPRDPKRKFRVEATRTELVQQPEAIESTWSANATELSRVAQLIASRELTHAFLVGAGDSLAVMIAARQLLETTIGIPCEPVQSLDFAYYMDHVVTERTLVIALSSSGVTTRTVEAALVAQHRGALTIALTNTPGSALAEECAEMLVIKATRVGWPTQASTAALALIYRLGIEVGRRRGVSRADDLDLALSAMPETIASVISAHEPAVAEAAEAEKSKEMYLFSAGGPNWASAIIGAAKVRECSPNHAQAIQVEEYHHYNSQKPGEPLWIVAPAGRTVPRAVDTARDATRYGGALYVVATEGDASFEGHAENILYLPAVPEILSPLAYVVPVQMFGYHVAMAKFRVADRAAEA